MIGIAARHKQRVLDALKKQGPGKIVKTNDVKKPLSSNKANGAIVHHDNALHESHDIALKELMRDLERLKDISDIAEKIEYKRQALLPKYVPLVDKSRQTGAAIHNDVVVYTLIWLIDAEDIESALELADFAIDNAMSMPDRFKRDLPTYVAEEIFSWADRQYKANASAAPYFDTVIDRIERGQWSVTHYVVLNKLYKLHGLFAERKNDWPTAVHYFEKCVDVNPIGHGVKTKLSHARSKLSSPPPTQPDVSTEEIEK